MLYTVQYNTAHDLFYFINKHPTVTRQLEEFLYIRKEHVENNLFVKYNGQMANFNKVIKLLKFKSAANIHCFQWEAQSRDRPKKISQQNAFSRFAPPIGNNANSLQIWTLKAL